jgi:hypothetical protein
VRAVPCLRGRSSDRRCDQISFIFIGAGVKWPRREAYNSLTSGVEVKYDSGYSAAALCALRSELRQLGCLALARAWKGILQLPCEEQNSRPFVAADISGNGDDVWVTDGVEVIAVVRCGRLICPFVSTV